MNIKQTGIIHAPPPGDTLRACSPLSMFAEPSANRILRPFCVCIELRKCKKSGMNPWYMPQRQQPKTTKVNLIAASG